MKLFISSKKIKELQNLIPELMEQVSLEYNSKANDISKNTSFFKKLIYLLKVPPSLRFFNSGEFYAKGEDYKKLKMLREIYHNAWHIENIFPNFKETTSDNILELDQYDTEVFIIIAEYLNIQYSNYQLLKKENIIKELIID